MKQTLVKKIETIGIKKVTLIETKKKNLKVLYLIYLLFRILDWLIVNNVDKNDEDIEFISKNILRWEKSYLRTELRLAHSKI